MQGVHKVVEVDIANTRIVFNGRKGYVMCGYLDLKTAAKFNQVACKITGVSTIKEARATHIHSLTPEARKFGIYKGQPVKEALKLIA